LLLFIANSLALPGPVFVELILSGNNELACSKPHLQPVVGSDNRKFIG
jgi:hypothetical protein